MREKMHKSSKAASKAASKTAFKAASFCLGLFLTVCSTAGAVSADLPAESVTFTVSAGNTVLLPGEDTTLSVSVSPSPAFSSLNCELEVIVGDTVYEIPDDGSGYIEGIVRFGDGVLNPAGPFSPGTAVCGKGTFAVFGAENGTGTAADNLLIASYPVTLADDISAGRIEFRVKALVPGDWVNVDFDDLSEYPGKIRYQNAVIQIPVDPESDRSGTPSAAAQPAEPSKNSAESGSTSVPSGAAVPVDDPVIVPIKTQTQAPATPVPFAGIIAALAAALILPGVKKK